MVECLCLMLTQLSWVIGKSTRYIVNVEVLFEFLLELLGAILIKTILIEMPGQRLRS